MKRIPSIDIVRGLVMVIMAIDHIRDLLHVSSLTQNPTDLTTTTPALFFTRWITHFCAPTFVFLAGTSAYLGLKNRSIAEGQKFLLTRGLWLIVLEFSLITFGLWWDIHFQVFLFQVIAAIGSGFVILALLLKVPPKILGYLGMLILVFHGLSALSPGANDQALRTINALFLGGGMVTPAANHFLYINYPIIPWLGVLLTGFGLGHVFELSDEQRAERLLKLGLIALAVFVALRIPNLYGDPAKWAMQKDPLYSLMSFINVSKYPPSLLFCLLTLGGMFLLLFIAEKFSNALTRVLNIYGKVPLFYYLVHWYLAHMIMFVILFAQGFKSSDFVFGFNFGRPNDPSGLPLWGIYLVWIGVVAALYPLCSWYSKYKGAHPEKWWLRYL